MKLNREKLNELLSKDDSALWKEIHFTAKKFGYSLPEKAPDENSMSKIRSVLRDADKLSALDIARLLGSLKEKRKEP